MKIPVFVLSVQYTLDRYPSICSAIKCPLEITADDYFITLNGVVYDAIQAAYIVLRIIGYSHVSCLPSTTIVHASVWLPNCMFCSCVCMCERATRNAQISSQMYGHLHALHFILYLTFTASLYDRKYACFHMGVVRSISRLIHGIARQIGASN